MTHRTSKLALVMAVTATAFCGACTPRTGSVDDGGITSIEVDQAMARVYPALVRIYVVMERPGGGRMQRGQGAGSGAIISEDGYVVTNHHVAGNASRIVCSLANFEEVDAELVGTDALTDIAVLKLRLDQRKDAATPVPVATWGDSDAVEVGDVVLALGSPAAVSQSVTKGIVSNTQLIMPKSSRGAFRLDGENVGSVVRWLAHDAVIFGGNSGGPLVNTRGEIVGINEIGLGSLGGAIPANVARNSVAEIIKHGHVRRSFTGLELQPRLKSDASAAGVLVAGIIKDSPATEAGLAAGDVVTSFDGQAVDAGVAEQLPIVNHLIMSTPIGKTVTVAYSRDGKAETCELTTGTRQRALAKPAELKAWGVTARNLTRMMALERKRENADGVLIGSSRAGGPCAEAKPAIRGGDVIVAIDGQPIKDVATLRKRTKKLTTGVTERVRVLVTFERGKRQLLTAVKIGKEAKKEKPARARKPWPAVDTQVLTRDLAEALGMKGKTGVRVTRIHADRAAEKAKLKVGDIILAVDDFDIEATEPEDVEIYATMLRQYRVGAEVELKIVRDGKERKLKMTLEAPPVSADRMKRHEDEDFEFTARNLSFADRTGKDLDKTTAGVLIEKIEPAGWASLGGVAGGDVLLKVDGTATPDVDALKAILAERKKTKPRRITFFLRRGIHTIYREIEPGWEQ